MQPPVCYSPLILYGSKSHCYESALVLSFALIITVWMLDLFQFLYIQPWRVVSWSGCQSTSDNVMSSGKACTTCVCFRLFPCPLLDLFHHVYLLSVGTLVTSTVSARNASWGCEFELVLFHSCTIYVTAQWSICCYCEYATKYSNIHSIVQHY